MNFKHFVRKGKYIVVLLALVHTGCEPKLAMTKTAEATATGEIVWDYTTLKRVSASSADNKYAGYARMIQRPDQSLLCIYEYDGNIVVARSSDLGTTWSAPVTVATKQNGINMAVPDILELQDHSLLACYNGRPYQIDPSRKFSIKTKKSTDGGSTWNDEKVLYEAGYQFENGCWEPSAIQLPSGEIQLFFANEGIYTSSSEQNISLLRSADNGESWTKTPEIVSFSATKRDGMPVPVLLKNGQEIAFSIEDNSSGNFKPVIIRNTLQENWAQTVDAASKNRTYALAEKIGNEIYAGAPFLRQLKTGETILSYQGTEGRVNNLDFADMKVVVGSSEAKDFSSKSTPFVIPGDKSCLWNSLCILNDDTIIAITSTNAYSNHSEVWMVKGKYRAGSPRQAQSIYQADPTIFFDKGTYYLYGTSSDNGFLVYASKDLKSWTGPAGSKNGYALSKGDAFGTKGFWAPQVYSHNNKYYMAYTADEQIAIAQSDSPLGPFTQAVKKNISGTGKQIDPFVFFDTDGKPFLYHVKLQEGNRIFVSEMKTDLTDIIPGTARECISGTAPWENTAQNNWPVTEGPTVVKEGKYYFMIYSANDFRSSDYAVGYATSKSPEGPWTKYEGNPIISKKTVKHNGTGHGDLFKDASGKYHYVMHTHFSDTQVSPRKTGLINMEFTGNGDSPSLLTADSSSFSLLSAPIY
ncbi:BNR repeat-like domain-containing protein [Pedobacter westerhofensis]|uniref:BNR repeat-like domain-containing protein n=1 Tax=Pedobacter westerhofensis TaxID=425512 RepID=A0A521D4C2_9SPHI|nr:family 43 glycosylhydrolase [Pedobacter westerhofensis]SMO65931.1 BNR repeat-like domain-containing protein [Pedobacter westerhofensis]